MQFKQLQTFEDACSVEGLDADKVKRDLENLPELDKQPMTAYAKLLLIARAANRLANNDKPWIPDWSSDNDEWKYYPWFEMRGSSGFRCDGFGWLVFGFARRLSPLLHFA